MPADSQKMGHGVKSGGRRIDNHSFFAGSANKDSVFPKGVHTKHESSAEGAGELMNYEDTSEKIHKAQEESKKKAHAHKSKEMYRN